MDSEEFKEFGTEVLDYVAKYRDSLRDRNVKANVEPGYLHKRLPKEAPKHPESWRQIMKDLDEHYMHGMTHWQSPLFNGFYPSISSYPSVIGELITAGMGCLCLSWDSNPPGTELEVIVLNWMAKMIGLPEMFLNTSPGPGGGVLQTSASECNLVTLLAAKEATLQRLNMDGSVNDQSKLVVYSSDQSNACVERMCLLGSVKIRLLPSDKLGRLRPGELEKAIKEDVSWGLIPFFVVATLGTTQTCAFDDLTEIGPICQKYKLWLHVDAAYAGAAFACPEYRHLMKGIEFADSFCFNPHKLLLITFDTSALWMKDASKLWKSFQVDRVYLKGEQRIEDKRAPDFRHWQISLGKKVRSLKVWVTLRIYGVSGIQNHIRNHFSMAKRFEDHVTRDKRFSLVSSSMGVVIFTLKDRMDLNQALVDEVNKGLRMFMMKAHLNGADLLRYSVAGERPNEGDVDEAWSIITSNADKLLMKTIPREKAIAKRGSERI